MTDIITIVVDRGAGDRLDIHYNASDGLTPEQALAVLRAVEAKVQEVRLEEEVRRRLEQATAPAEEKGEG